MRIRLKDGLKRQKIKNRYQHNDLVAQVQDKEGHVKSTDINIQKDFIYVSFFAEPDGYWLVVK